jgi:alkanesulfonate monooxygenase SsuD/methylene tetrahydromethanopterin reductase-like flavin-dependent oxidoreductase (luciferase family)
MITKTISRREGDVDLGIGIGNTLLGMDGLTMVKWARLAEARGFSSLASIGRVAWPGYDELAAFAAAAAVTGRIELLTDVLLAPTYPTARLAKLTASVDRLSNGRLTLGLGVGARPDDYVAAEQDFTTRGKRFDEQLEALHESWAGRPPQGATQPLGPTTVRERIPILFGGDPTRAARRAVRWDGGFTVGGAPPEMAAGMIETFRAAYDKIGGMGNPRVVCLTYFGLGETEEESIRQLRAYYAFIAERAEWIAKAAVRSADDVRVRIDAFREIGADELIFRPSVPDTDQVDLLADAVGLPG